MAWGLVGDVYRRASVSVDVHREDRFNVATVDGRPALPRWVAVVVLEGRERSSAVIGQRLTDWRKVQRVQRTFGGETAWQDAERWAGDVSTAWSVAGVRPVSRRKVSA